LARRGERVDMKKVLAEGPTDAEIILIGEAPAYHEMMEGRPFVGCYDTSTEVLTQRGWLSYEKLKEDDLFFSLEPSSETIELIRAKRIIIASHKGPMYYVKTNQVDLLVTLNHNMLVKPYVKRIPKKDLKAKFISAIDVHGKNVHYMKSGKWIGLDAKTLSIGSKHFSAPYFLYFLGFFIGDGWMRKNPRTPSEANEIAISQVDTEEAAKILVTLGHLGLDYKIQVRDDNHRGTILIHSPELASYFRPLGDAYTKYIPKEILKLSPRLLRCLFEGLMDSDGCQNRLYYTVSKSLRDDFQELCLKLGMSASWGSRWREGYVRKNDEIRRIESTTPCYELSVNRKHNTPRVYLARANRDNSLIFEERWIDYDGIVWCVELERNHTLYVRRNSKPVWSGNSAGGYLNMLLSASGLYRGELYITNLSKVRAPNDKMSQMPLDQLRHWENDLIDEINRLSNPKILVPLGDYPLHAITGRSGITNLRGSALKPIHEIHHDCIVIPTRHPSVLHYQYSVWPLIVADFMRVKGIADGGFKFTFPQYNFLIRPSFDQVMKTLDSFEDDPEHFRTLDVEFPHGLLSCIGIGWSRSEAISIPFFMGNGSNYWSENEEFLIWKRLDEVLPKLNLGNQNVLFDWEVMYHYKIRLRPPKWDPMLMHACLYSELPHKLHVITSIYTDIPFYKRDEEDVKRSTLRAGFEEDHWKYNCLDCVSTLWAIEELRKELEEENMMDVYQDLFVELFMPVFQMNTSGILIDVEKLEPLRDELEKIIKHDNEILKKAAGRDINPNSPKQVKEFLYGDLGMQPHRSKGGTLSVDKKMLEKLAYKYQSDIPHRIIDVRQNTKMLSIFSKDNIDEDNKVRCSFSLTTKTGRFASHKNIFGRGMNLQNVKMGLARSLFLPEKGHLIVAPDQDQAEARIVAWLSKDANIQSIFESGLSVHLENAKNIFGEYVLKDDPRYRIAKSLVHAGNYGIGPEKFAITAGITLREAKSDLEVYHNLYPGIRNFFHRYVKDQLRATRTLYNPFGRRQIFFDRLNDETFRKGFAFIPQSTISDLNKKALREIAKFYRVLIETHDGLLISVPENEIESAIELIKDAYNIKFKIWDVEHTIPITISVGPNWADLTPIK